MNRNDYCQDATGRTWGVGMQLLNSGSHDQQEVDVILALLKLRRRCSGDGVMALDCGANIGVHTVEWARSMHGWGEVIAFEAQEKIYYALAGNVVLNNCLNVSAQHCAVGASCGNIDIPEPDYLTPASFGSLELKKRSHNEFIGQIIDYEKTKAVRQISIDSLQLKRLDLIKIDVEGMEEEVLAGAKQSIAKFAPVMMVEILKSDKSIIEGILIKEGYRIFLLGIMLLAVHGDDPIGKYFRWRDGSLLIE